MNIKGIWDTAKVRPRGSTSAVPATAARMNTRRYGIPGTPEGMDNARPTPAAAIRSSVGAQTGRRHSPEGDWPPRLVFGALSDTGAMLPAGRL